MARSRFDFIEQRQADGFSRDFWLSDSAAGRKRIADLERLAREIELAPAAPTTPAAHGATRADLEAVIDAAARLISKRGAEYRAELETLRREVDVLKRELEALKAEQRSAAPLRAVGGRAA